MNPSRLRLWLFGLFGVGLAVSITIAQIALALLILDAFVRGLSDGASRPSPIAGPILAVVAWGVAVTLFAHSAGVVKAVSSQTAVLLFFLAVRVWSVEDNEHWIRCYVIAAAITGVFAVIQVALNVDRYPLQDELVVPPWLSEAPEKFLRAVSLRNERAVGTRSHPLTFAESLLGAFVLLVAAPMWNSVRQRRFRWSALAFVSAGLLFSQSRGVWVGAVIAGLAMGWFWRRDRRARLIMGASLAAAFLALVAVPKFRARALSIVAPASGQAADQASRSVRFGIWARACESIVDHPVAGVGIRGVKLPAFDPGLGKIRLWSETHNIFFQAATERGLVGFGLLLWALALVLMSALRSPPGWREAGVGVFIAFMIAGLTESWMNDKEIAMIFWALVGAIERRRLASPDAV